MATILLSAAGAALGGFVGGGALGLSSAVIGRAIGATIGRAIDQKLMGAGSETVETGKLDRMRIMGASEGAAIPRVFGRSRVAGNVIWTSNYRETSTKTETGGKGAPKGPTVTNYAYSISMAVALCEGEISRVGRIWADGNIIAKDDVTMHVYTGAEDQQPDPLMVSIEGADHVPAYRGVAYVVFEDLPLADYGNRVPQFTFEVIRRAQPEGLGEETSLADVVQGVALLPGSGEYALATTPAYVLDGNGQRVPANQNSAGGQSDLLASLDALTGELPHCRSTSLVVSWFGDDLRAGQCRCLPKVEVGADPDTGVGDLGSTPVFPGTNLNAAVWAKGAGTRDRTPWGVAGLTRATAETVAKLDGRPIYGGTPSDAAVVEAIDALKAAGQEVMFYPFLLMEVLQGNAIPDPWTGEPGQAELPWRGRITTELAPGLPGSTDKTEAARAEVAAFMGTAQPADFGVSGRTVQYDGPEEYSYRRFILHYACLCAAAGGVEAFCIGSEMRALTQIRDEMGGFPAIEALRQLAEEVKAILPDTKIGYAADWSEYFGYHPQDGSGDVLFHLDPLWADPAIDFIGIDNYMPISDWRDGESHADVDARKIYNLEYLTANVAGGEGYDWFYASREDRDAQQRSPISDGAYGEDWVFRYKDLAGWWSNPHHNREAGIRAVAPTDWVPQSKPFWFTELGCGAVDKASNQPNKFQDAKSSESALPYFSRGRRDDYIQLQYLRAFHRYFSQPAHNPVSGVYGAPMLDMSKTHVWAWDARPWPDFPNNVAVWSDGENHLTGHWLTGRSASQTLAGVVAELCEVAGVMDYDVIGLGGIVRGYTITDVESARASLQNLMVTFGFDAIEAGGRVTFRDRDAAPRHVVGREAYVLPDDGEAVLEVSRAPEAELVGEVRLGYAAGDGAFENHVASARFPGDSSVLTTQNDVPISLTAAEARGVTERWLAEARVARDTVRVALPPSMIDIRAGDLVELEEHGGQTAAFRVDRIEDAGARLLEGTRVERQVYEPSDIAEGLPAQKSFVRTLPITAQFMDLPLLTDNEVPHAPHIAVTARPWPGSAAVFSAPDDSNYRLNRLVERPSIMGVTQTALASAEAGRWSKGPILQVKLHSGALSSASRLDVLGGANAAAIGDGSTGNWEIIQFAGAELVGSDTYALSELLRGQAGSDGVMPALWPSGSRFVMLDGGPEQLEQALSARGLARHFRVGPGNKPYDDASYEHYIEAMDGIGLRPYRPVHLRTMNGPEGRILRWTRRTRLDGDSWASVEVPLGEEVEAYLVQVTQGATLVRETTVNVPSWTYGTSLAASDGLVGSYEIQVAQISQSFGPGPFARIMIND
jgi:hypothetical protein